MSRSIVVNERIDDIRDFLGDLYGGHTRTFLAAGDHVEILIQDPITRTKKMVAQTGDTITINDNGFVHIAIGGLTLKLISEE
jgi:hypothetical protein